MQVSSEKVRNVNSDPQLGFVNAHGYVSLFPFLLQILSPDSDKLGGGSYRYIFTLSTIISSDLRYHPPVPD